MRNYLRTIFMIFFCWILLLSVAYTGEPAARVGDMTAHGGMITTGCGTVLIGGKPASRVGDMHVCPMVTPGHPPILHAGGPIYTGSPTVIICGSPAARVGDMAICNGPPDTIIQGCPTVLIGGSTVVEKDKVRAPFENKPENSQLAKHLIKQKEGTIQK